MMPVPDGIPVVAYGASEENHTPQTVNARNVTVYCVISPLESGGPLGLGIRAMSSHPQNHFTTHRDRTRKNFGYIQGGGLFSWIGRHRIENWKFCLTILSENGQRNQPALLRQYAFKRTLHHCRNNSHHIAPYGPRVSFWDVSQP